MKQGWLALLLFISLTGLGGQIASAQLLKVEQVVYGMDCAPCAYGMERSFNKMKGLENVRVSLNEGKAYLTLSETHQVTLQAIQQKVKEGGFTAKQATIVLEGELEKQGDAWIIQQNDEIFRLTQAPEDTLMSSFEAGQRVKIRGKVEDVKHKALDNRWKVQLKAVLS